MGFRAKTIAKLDGGSEQAPQKMKGNPVDGQQQFILSFANHLCDARHTVRKIVH